MQPFFEEWICGNRTQHQRPAAFRLVWKSLTFGLGLIFIGPGFSGTSGAPGLVAHSAEL